MAGGKEPAPLDCYVRVEPPRAEQAAILENEVRPPLQISSQNHTSGLFARRIIPPCGNAHAACLLHRC